MQKHFPAPVHFNLPLQGVLWLEAPTLSLCCAILVQINYPTVPFLLTTEKKMLQPHCPTANP